MLGSTKSEPKNLPKNLFLRQFRGYLALIEKNVMVKVWGTHNSKMGYYLHQGCTCSKLAFKKKIKKKQMKRKGEENDHRHQYWLWI